MTPPMRQVVLASTSRSRQALLAGAGVVFTAQSPGVDEGVAKQALLAEGASPKHVAEVLAGLKAAAVSRLRPGLVIGADQTLEVEARLVDKADSLEEARARLLDLRGKRHHLHSAVVVARDGDPIWETVETASLEMRDFSDAFLDAYLAQAGEQVLGSVGCYQLEGVGLQLFDRVEGDYFTILGLPMLGLLDLLRREGALER
jgi:septum formation protein